ncbi:MAG: hypothetical protein CL916_10765 [Deltaproteobacteria bacterium]|nr:hypothetical protein [Deltaproteobacteria bacterium]
MKIAIIGGGPAGSASVYFARKHFPNAEVTIFEGASQLGGRTTSIRKEGWVVDTGAGFVTNFYPRLFSIAKDYGFSEEIIEMNRISGLSREGSMASLNVGSTKSFLQFPLLSMLEKAKMAWWTGKMTWLRSKLDLAHAQSLAEHDTMSIEEYALSELNDNIYHSLIRPGIEPFWYFSCQDVSRSLLMALTANAAGARFYSVPSGIDIICAELAKGAVHKLNHMVQHIREEDKGYTVISEHNGNERVASFDRIVVATTASVAQQISQDVNLVPTVRSFLTSQTYASNIHICFRIPTQSQPPRAGSIFPCDSNTRLLAAISFHRAKQPHYDREEELVSIYLSDVGAKKMMEASDEQVAQFAWDKAKEYCPELPQKSEIFSIHRRKEAIPVHAVGRYRRAVEAQKGQVDSNIQFCGDYWASATIEGAIATAEEAIQRWT